MTIDLHPSLKEGQKEVVVIGGGFAGLAAAKELASSAQVHVTLVDQRNHHLFQPLLYQVATAGLNPADIAVPIRAQFSGDANVSVHQGRIDRVDLEQKYFQVGEVRMAYDYLIIAAGASHSYFGHPEWEERAPGLKTVEQATEIRRRILGAFEAAENEPDPERQKALLTFVVVGGGPTGVELAGAIADISRTVLVKDFRRINPASARILLAEAGPRILPVFPAGLSRRATDDLQTLGVEVITGAMVKQIDGQGVLIGEQRVAAANAFWAAGVQAEPLSRTLGVELDRAGRIPVARDLSLPSHPEVFAVGDIAHLELEPGKLLPGVAPAAIQAGRTAARNILASVNGQPREDFRYQDKGTMATIGKHKAVAFRGRWQLAGFLAWVGWLFVHVLYLVGFKNRIAVFSQWVWSYLFSRRGSRLITQSDWRLLPGGPARGDRVPG